MWNKSGVWNSCGFDLQPQANIGMEGKAGKHRDLFEAFNSNGSFSALWRSPPNSIQESFQKSYLYNEQQHAIIILG